MAVAVNEEQVTKQRISLHGQLADFLAVPEAAMKIYNERFSGDLLTDQEIITKNILAFQLDHINEYGEAATYEVVEHTFGHAVTFAEPACELYWLLDQFRIRYSRNQAAEVTKELAQGLKHSDPMEAVQTALVTLGKIKEKTRRGSISLVSDDYSALFDEHRLKIDRIGSNLGVSFGFPEVDEHLCGIQKNQLVYVIGRPKRYKSWMLLKSAAAAQRQGHVGVFFPLEMGNREMFFRYACMATNMSWSKFSRNELPPHEWDVMEAKMAKMKNDPTLHFLCPERGERTVGHLRALARERDADIIYIDQLKFLELSGKSNNIPRTEKIEYINEELKDLATEFPIYIACQFNREAESMKEMADLSKIGLSDSIGQTADTLMGLYQNKDMRASSKLHFGIIESRSFDPKVWELQVDLSRKGDFSVVDVYEQGE